jgi:predicted MFS family arabinose efflux permease
VTAAAFNPQRLALGGLLAMAAALGIGRFIYTPILPGMVEDLHLTKGQAGLIAAANFLGYLAGALATVAASGRGDRRRLLLVALAASAGTTAVRAVSSDMAALLFWRIAGGVASACALVLASALVLDRLSATGHTGYSALHFSGVGAGISVSAAMTWVLGADGLGWRAMWLGGGVLSLLALMAVAVLIPAHQDATARAAAPRTLPARKPPMALLAIAYGLFGFGYVITATFIVAIVRGSADAKALEPVIWLALGLAAIPSVSLWVGTGRRIGVMPAFALACLVEAIGVFASVASRSVGALLVASVLLGGTFVGITSLGLIGGRDLAPDRPQHIVGALTAAFGVGQIVGPVVAGYGYDFTGSFFWPSMLAVAALIIGAILAMVIHARQRVSSP